jgi:hypothetical protein
VANPHPISHDVLAACALPGCGTITSARSQPEHHTGRVGWVGLSTELAHGPGGPRGARTHNPRIKGRRIATTVASTCDCVLTASPTSPTSRPWFTSFHATNHATPAAVVPDSSGCRAPHGARRSSRWAGVIAAERRSRGRGRRLATRVVAGAVLVPRQDKARGPDVLGEAAQHRGGGRYRVKAPRRRRLRESRPQVGHAV